MCDLKSGFLNKISIIWLSTKRKYETPKIMKEYIFSQNSASVSN